MNLGKCVLAFTALSVFMTFSVSAADPVNYVVDTFEDGAAGVPATQYKATCSEPGGTGLITTNFVWSDEKGDASTLACETPVFAGCRPTTNAVGGQVLCVSTEGLSLTRKISESGIRFDLNPVYVDMLVKFVPCEEAPIIHDYYVDAALFVNSSSNLVVYHAAEGPEGGCLAMTDVGVPVVLDQWHRLTVYFGRPSEYYETTGFQVYLDGVKMTASSAYDEDGNTGTNGTWFIIASYESCLSSLVFRGDMKVDELVVSDQANGIGPSAPLSSGKSTTVFGLSTSRSTAFTGKTSVLLFR